MLLSILIPSVFSRQLQLYDLMGSLHDQIDFIQGEHFVVIMPDIDNKEVSIGAKRQRLLEKATGDYICFIDDDDEVSSDYIQSIVSALLAKRPDVIGFEGYMTTNGQNREDFKISKDLGYEVRKDEAGKIVYYRFNNHLCPIKRDIALQIGYKDQPFAEDYDYALRLKSSGLIETEVYIPRQLYHYKYLTPKPLNF